MSEVKLLETFFFKVEIARIMWYYFVRRRNGKLNIKLALIVVV